MLNPFNSSPFTRRRMLSWLCRAAGSMLASRKLWPAIARQASPQSKAPTPLASFSGIRFEEIAAKSGLNFTTHNCATPNKNQP